MSFVMLCVRVSVHCFVEYTLNTHAARVMLDAGNGLLYVLLFPPPGHTNKVATSGTASVQSSLSFAMTLQS